VSTDIYVEEWLAELDAAMGGMGDAGVTLAEMAGATNHCPAWVSKRLRRLIHDGRIAVGRAKRPAIDGTMRPVPVYRLAKQHPEE
jgi:hypothetical protein